MQSRKSKATSMWHPSTFTFPATPGRQVPLYVGTRTRRLDRQAALSLLNDHRIFSARRFVEGGSPRGFGPMGADTKGIRFGIGPSTVCYEVCDKKWKVSLAKWLSDLSDRRCPKRANQYRVVLVRWATGFWAAAVLDARRNLAPTGAIPAYPSEVL